MALDAGIHTIAADEYHTDPCEQPSLSAHIAALFCSRSARHAWAAHPRLNPDFERVDEQKFDRGTAAHALLLDGDDIIHVVEADNWRTKVAQEVRDKARENGLIPLLSHEADEVLAMVEAVRAQLAAIEVSPPLICDGKPEQTLVWDEDGVTCRARLDWLRDDRRAIDDLKTTAGSAHPRDWSQRRLWDIGADVQAAFYLRGLKALTGASAEFRFVVVETSPPYAVSPIALAPSALELANEKVEWAIAKWRGCLRDDDWPAYLTQVAYAEAPTWEQTRWMEARWHETHEGVIA